MPGFIEIKRQPVAELCRRCHVRRLDVFGSASRDDFDPESSDIDLLVEFESSAASSLFDDYFSLREGLELLFAKPVDLVMASALRNPYVQNSIDSQRLPLYGA